MLFHQIRWLVDKHKHRMLSNRLFLFYLMIIIVLVIKFGESRTCIPNKLILLSNCSFRYSSYQNYSSYLSNKNNTKMTNDNQTLLMTVPYPLNKNEEENLLITILIHNSSSKPLIRFNLNMIQCTNENLVFNWTSLESSSTLRGEFVRTIIHENNNMYLTSGKTYLRNLSTIDCSTKTLYRTDSKQLFELDLRIESTLNDYCTNDNSCYPSENYQCNQEKHRCICRQPLQSYLIKDQYPICIQAYHTIDQCTLNNIRCLEWCQPNKTSTMCVCPENISTKKILNNNRAYCESRTGETCNSFIQCPLGDTCEYGICQNINNKSYQSFSLDIATISIIISCLILFMISVILAIGIYILRRQRWKKHYLTPIDSVCTKQQQITVPTMSDYDNVTFGPFRTNVQHSSSDDNDSSPMTTSDEYSYEPKIIYLGGEQQLTAIFA